MRILSLIFSALISCLAYGYDSYSTNIEHLRVYRSMAIITLAVEAPNPNNCTKTWKDYGAGRYAVIKFENEEGKEMYSAVLAAYMSGRKIELGLLDGSENCYDWGGGDTIPIVYRVEVYKS